MRTSKTRDQNYQGQGNINKQVAESNMKKVSRELKNRVSSVLHRGPIKLAVGLAVGVVVLSGTALYFGPSQVQDHHDPVASGVGSNGLLTNFSRIHEEGKAADRRDEAQDMILYRQQAEEAAKGKEAYRETSGLSYEQQRADDRRDEAQDMILYWQQAEEAAKGREAYRETSGLSYEQQRAADSLQERIELREYLTTDRGNSL